MASYNQPCVHCGEFVERDSRLCPKCGSRSPFGYQCPSCLREIVKGQPVCSQCGRSLTVICPTCTQLTFTDERCEHCDSSLLIQCANPRCGDMQFFENVKCTACGKKIKKQAKK